MHTEVALKDKALAISEKIWRRLPSTGRHAIIGLQQAKYFVGVVGLIKDDQDRVLILEHRFRVPWVWGLPGGYVDRGETFEETLLREAKEETGFDIEVGPEILDVELCHDAPSVTITLGARILSGTLRLSAEIKSARFCLSDDLPAGIHPRHRQIIERSMSSKDLRHP